MIFGTEKFCVFMFMLFLTYLNPFSVSKMLSEGKVEASTDGLTGLQNIGNTCF